MLLLPFLLLLKIIFLVYLKDKMVENLVRANLEANRHARDSRDTPKVLELDVDCTDPYGRYEIDADGCGGITPMDESTNNVDNGADGNVTGPSSGVGGSTTSTVAKSTSTKLPLKRVTVFVSTTPPVQNQQTVVLSAAVSSTKRIYKDCCVAVKLSQRLDIARNIPSELSCQSVLVNLFPTLMDDDGSIGEQRNDESGNNGRETFANALDVTIAYLRRVHLFTFYNGCTFSNNVGSVLGNNHPTGIIHVRLKGADEILKKTREENADIYDDLPMGNDRSKIEEKNPTKEEVPNSNKGNDEDSCKMTKVENNTTNSTEAKDMLVMRLDDSIEKILQIINDNMDTCSRYAINESVDALAREIESLEERSKREWISNHAVIDNDGRARCSFHFCNKLFKDKTFLQKHLLKKHPEFLEAEKAKLHDSYMMDWWDKEECRPVPHVSIDCGPKFGLMVSQVKGASQPSVTDPEPDMWREEQERILKMEEEEKNREKIAAAESMDQHRRKNEEFLCESNQMMNPNTASSNFVDVDDMKDEKIELSFDNVNVAAITTSSSGKKKKKKKKKLL